MAWEAFSARCSPASSASRPWQVASRSSASSSSACWWPLRSQGSEPSSSPRRSSGATVLAFLNEHAKSLGCKYLELDSGTKRLDADRFSRREGLEEVALHFSKPTGAGPRWTQQD